jgi:hypothetical protein
MAEKPITRIPYRHMTWVWVTDHYDIHIAGLCRYAGALCRFETDYPRNTWRRKLKCRVYQLSPIAKVRWLLKKRLFEICVGRHCTYSYRGQGETFGTRKPRWLYALLFALYYRNFRLAWSMFYRRKRNAAS